MGAVRTVSTSPSVPVRGGLAVVLAVVVNVGIVLSADATDIAPGVRALSMPPVVALSAVGAGGATVAYWLAARSVPNVDRTFMPIAAAVLLLSFVPDIGLLVTDPAATLPGVVVLMTMHTVVATLSVGLLVYWRADR